MLNGPNSLDPFMGDRRSPDFVCCRPLGSVGLPFASNRKLKCRGRLGRTRFKCRGRTPQNVILGLASAWRWLRVGLGRFGGAAFHVGSIWHPLVVGVAAVSRCFGLAWLGLASASLFLTCLLAQIQPYKKKQNVTVTMIIRCVRARLALARVRGSSSVAGSNVRGLIAVTGQKKT